MHRLQATSISVLGFALMMSVLWLLGDAGQVHACSCGPPGSASERLEKADAVFAGRPVVVREFPYSSYYDNWEPPPNVYGFAVSEVWKGMDYETNYVVEHRGSTCENGFLLGLEYLVFAHRYSQLSPDLIAGVCSLTTPVMDAQSLLDELGEGRAPQPGSSAPPPREFIGDPGIVLSPVPAAGTQGALSGDPEGSTSVFAGRRILVREIPEYPPWELPSGHCAYAFGYKVSTVWEGPAYEVMYVSGIESGPVCDSSLYGWRGRVESGWTGGDFLIHAAVREVGDGLVLWARDEEKPLSEAQIDLNDLGEGRAPKPGTIAPLPWEAARAAPMVALPPTPTAIAEPMATPTATAEPTLAPPPTATRTPAPEPTPTPSLTPTPTATAVSQLTPTHALRLTPTPTTEPALVQDALDDSAGWAWLFGLAVAATALSLGGIATCRRIRR